MNYIALAEKTGLNKDLVVPVYKKINGGYFVSLSYAKPPILYTLDNWPKKYVRKNFLLWGLTKHFENIDRILSLFITLDVYFLHSMAAILSRRNFSLSLAEKDIEKIFKLIEEEALSQGFTSYPRREDITIDPVDIQALAVEVVEKRKREEINADLYYVVDEIAYQSDYVNELKGKKSWVKSVKRGDMLKAIGIQGKMDEFFEAEKSKLVYLVASTTLYFDNKVTEVGITDTIKQIKSEDPILIEELNKLREEIKKKAEYF
ncbi:hypothetical protein [Stygiolobus caldivivus]|uniref:Uncharacterized protein n=1 Tax=Stygiolobus caldivivus TaxID=2824673 RepID=A0A8D5U569_9CREN|nr:hypothetical protein [Stygiolobus caldivivus]BCU69293.1 hypothetical protein KN1_05900 [Stygiolobus caldivivus]